MIREFDNFQGHGIHHYNDGSRYIGQWKNGKKHGEGTYFLKDASSYKGVFFENLMHGAGVLTVENNHKIKEIKV
jgi:hypothetical protein